MIVPICIDTISKNRKLTSVQIDSSVKPNPFLSAQFEDIEDLCQQVRLWDLDLRPLSKVAPERDAGSVFQANAGALSYGYCSLNASLDQYGSAPHGVITFVIKDADMERLWWRGNDTDSDDILVYQVGSELRSISNPSFSIQTVSASQDALEAVAASMKVKLPVATALPEVFRMPGQALHSIRKSLEMFRVQIAMQSGLELYVILEELLRAWTAQANTRFVERPNVRARDRAMAQSLEFLEVSDLAGVSPAALRQITGVSERTLEYAFRERFGMTPAKFIKCRRLLQVRHHLKSADQEEQTIADIASSEGFWHGGHFSADYRAFFGELPQETRVKAGIFT